MRFLHLCGFGLLFDGCLNVAYLLVQPTNMGFERTLDHRVRTMLQVIFISLWSLTRCSRRLISRPHRAPYSQIHWASMLSVLARYPLLLAKARTRLALARWIGNPALRTVNIQSLSEPPLASQTTVLTGFPD